jgi:hypothetical protein
MQYKANPATNAPPIDVRQRAGSMDSTVNISYLIVSFAATFRGPDFDP